MELVSKIEERLAENKTSIKTYKTYEAASKVGLKLGTEFAHVRGYNDNVHYIVTYLPTTGRYTVVFRMMDWFSKHKEGGYIGHFANAGFFSI